MQVMDNLMSNAVKFSQKGATVDIGVEYFNDNIRVSVTDRGKGIPIEFQPSLFEKFTQSDSTDTRSVGGTGLGMNIVKKIVEKHNGEISFVSQENVGTTIYVDIKNTTTTSPGLFATEETQLDDCIHLGEPVSKEQV